MFLLSSFPPQNSSDDQRAGQEDLTKGTQKRGYYQVEITRSFKGKKPFALRDVHKKLNFRTRKEHLIIKEVSRKTHSSNGGKDKYILWDISRAMGKDLIILSSKAKVKIQKFNTVHPKLENSCKYHITLQTYFSLFECFTDVLFSFSKRIPGSSASCFYQRYTLPVI